MHALRTRVPLRHPLETYGRHMRRALRRSEGGAVSYERGTLVQTPEGYGQARTSHQVPTHRKVNIRLHGKGNSKIPWRKAGQPSYLVDVVDSD